MAEHTPTPWFSDRKFVVGPRPSTDDQSDGMLCGVADVYGENAKEDAEFIVRAVNSHDALVKAMTELLEHAESQGDFKNGVSHNGVDEGEVFASGLFDAARAALASAHSQEG